MHTIRTLGLLTAGGDCQGLNAALRAVTLAAQRDLGATVLGFHDGYVGLLRGDCRRLDRDDVAGILAQGGTILGTGRGRAEQGAALDDLVRRSLQQATALGLDALVCLGGDGTQRFARALAEAGLRVVTLPKTIDNDIRGTEVCFGFDSAVYIATEAIERLRTTAHSHSRVMLCEVMGRDAGWIALAAGLAGPAHVVLIPEIPYRTEAVVAALQARAARGRRYSIVVVAEGARSAADAAAGRAQKHAASLRLVDELQDATGIETRLTTLGYVLRGGAPTVGDRLLATELGLEAVRLLGAGVHGVMVGQQHGRLVPVPLAEAGSGARTVPPEHRWIDALRRLGACLGD